MKNRIIFTDEAIEDVLEAVNWYRGKTFNLGVGFMESLDEVVEKFPLILKSILLLIDKCLWDFCVDFLT